jgi:hypothetical protein
MNKKQNEAVADRERTSLTHLRNECPTEPDTAIDAPEYDELTEGFDPEKLGEN